MNVRPVLFILSLFSVAGAAAAEEAPPANEPALQLPALIGKMAEARALAAPAPVRLSRDGTNAVIAIWDAGADSAIRLVELRGCVSRTAGVKVSCRRYTSTSSEYVVTEPAGHLVLAAKTRVCVDYRCRRAQTEVRTPYAEAIHTPEMVAAGRAYLEDLVARAAAELDELGTASLAIAGEPVTAAVSERILAAILIVEHGRSDRVEKLGIGRVVDEFLVILAANGNTAFADTVSRAGARGIAQFIGSSYQLTRTRYGNARLLPGFHAGAADHLNAAKAQYCLADWTLTALRPATLADLRLPLFEEDLGAYVAAAYNGGERRAARAYHNRPRSWESLGRGLYPETVNYVRFFRLVYRQLWSATGTSQAAPDERSFDP